MSESLGEELDRLGWDTGSVLQKAHAERIRSFLSHPGGKSVASSENDWWVVVSQGCDVVARNETTEPNVELIRCGVIEKLRALQKNEHHPRELDFTSGATKLTTHSAKDRVLIPRSCLKGEVPDASRSLTLSAKTRLMRWLAARYTRTAFPSSLNDRLGDRRPRIIQALKEAGPLDYEFRLSVMPMAELLNAGDGYDVSLFLVVGDEDWEDDEAMIKINRLAASMDEIFTCTGIHLIACALKKGSEWTWDAAMNTHLWTVASLSLSEDEADEA